VNGCPEKGGQRVGVSGRTKEGAKLIKKEGKKVPRKNSWAQRGTRVRKLFGREEVSPPGDKPVPYKPGRGQGRKRKGKKNARNQERRKKTKKKKKKWFRKRGIIPESSLTGDVGKEEGKGETVSTKKVRLETEPVTRSKEPQNQKNRGKTGSWCESSERVAKRTGRNYPKRGEEFQLCGVKNLSGKNKNGPKKGKRYKGT